MDHDQTDVSLFQGDDKATLESALRDLLPRFRWFSGKARSIRAISLLDAVPMGHAGWLALARVTYEHGPDDTFVLPLALAMGADAERIAKENHGRLVVPIADRASASALLYDPLADGAFARELLAMIAAGAVARGTEGELVGWAGSKFSELRGAANARLDIALVKSEQSNSSIIFGNRLILKLFRRLEDGPNPELEIGAYLTERTGFTQIAPLAGALEWRRAGRPAGAVAVLQGFVPNQGDAWQHVLARLAGFLEHAMASNVKNRFSQRVSTLDLLTPISADVDCKHLDLEEAALLGRRTAELHLALAANAEDVNFASEPFAPDSQRRLREDCASLTQQTLTLLANKLSALPTKTADEARRLLAQRQSIEARFAALDRAPLPARRMRCHGDYHLGQVLFTGNDFVILDFEGEPARGLHERRAKHSPLKDVAGMLRSFDYAVAVARNAHAAEHPACDAITLLQWGNHWHACTCRAFLQAYCKAAHGASFLPPSLADLATLLDIYLLEKAVYELTYELNNRPDWVGIPLAAILQIIDTPEAS